MADSCVAGDGWGVGWFLPDASPSPGLLKSILPLWSDEKAKTATHAILSGSIVGHIRYASPNVETCFLNTPLYVLDDHLWTINGELTPWPGPLSKALRDRLDADHEADLRGATDGEMMGALWRTHFRRTGGRDATAAVRSMLSETSPLLDSRSIVRWTPSSIERLAASTNAPKTTPMVVRHVRSFCRPREPRGRRSTSVQRTKRPSIHRRPNVRRRVKAA